MREALPPPPQPGAASLSKLVAQSRAQLVGPTESEAPPRSRVRAPSAPVSPPRPAPGIGGGFRELSLRSFSVGTEHPLAPGSPWHTRNRPEVWQGRQTRCLVRPGRQGKDELRWGSAARGTREAPLPGPPRLTLHAAPRGGTDPEAEPAGACPAAGLGRTGGLGPLRRAAADEGSRPLSPGRARGKRKHLLGHHFLF